LPLFPRPCIPAPLPRACAVADRFPAAAPLQAARSSSPLANVYPCSSRLHSSRAPPTQGTDAPECLLPRQPRRSIIVALGRRCRGEVIRRRRFPGAVCSTITLLPLPCTHKTPSLPSKARSRGRNHLPDGRP
jgi:hypothetical protein